MAKKSYPRRGMGSEKFDKARQRQIAANGGRAAHAKGNAHEWTSEEARVIGRLGGLASGRSKRAADCAPFANQPESPRRDRALERWRTS